MARRYRGCAHARQRFIDAADQQLIFRTRNFPASGKTKIELTVKEPAERRARVQRRGERVSVEVTGGRGGDWESERALARARHGF